MLSPLQVHSPAPADVQVTARLTPRRHFQPLHDVRTVLTSRLVSTYMHTAMTAQRASRRYRGVHARTGRTAISQRRPYLRIKNSACFRRLKS